MIRQVLVVLVSLPTLFLLAGCNPVTEAEPAPEAVIGHYAVLAHAGYEDSLITALELQQAAEDFLAEPSEEGLNHARQAWLDARVPYQQTEVFRFGNPLVDAWEGRVNAWPLDEGLIDYTAPAYGTESDNNYFYTANIIANPSLLIGGIEINAADITPQLLSDTLHEIDGVEANVATGYHAIEFLLWGQDLNGTNPGAGNRPWTDYSQTACTNGHCDRRRDYLLSALSLLIADLEEMTANWERGGAAWAELMARGADGGLAAMLIGMGSLANAELATERVRLGLLLNDPEEEHDCFSDNTHNSHFYDAQGIENIYRGRYVRVSGEVIQGPSLQAILQWRSPEVRASMEAALDRTHSAMATLVSEAEAGRPYDVLIAPDNIEGEVIVTEVVDALVAETREIESIISVLGLADISLEG